MLRQHRYYLGLFWLVTIFVLPLPLIQAIAMGLSPIYAQSLFAINLGVIAYVWMLFELFIATRPKWLERLIGLPEMYFVHGMIGIGIIIVAYLHKLWSQSNGLIKLTGDAALIILIGVLLYSVFFLSGWLTDRVWWLRQVKQWLEHVFKHEISVWLHRLNIVATLLIFVHVLLIPYIRQDVGFMVWFYSYSALAFGLYGWDKVQSFRGHASGVLVANDVLSRSVQQITIRLRQRDRWHYQSGDYVLISFPSIAGMREPHPFSLLNAENDSDFISLMIRRDGDWTRQLRDVPVNTPVRITGAYGTLKNMVAQTPSRQPLVLLAGGSGIPPMLSLSHDYLKQGRQINLIWTAKTTHELVYDQVLADLKAQYPDTFQYRVHQGRFTVDELQGFLTEGVTNHYVYLLSGPNNMMSQTKKLLRRIGVSGDHVYFEKFSF